MDATYPDYQPPAPQRTSSKLKDLPPDEMPRERLLAHGPSVLSESELLAIVLGSGTRSLNVKEFAVHILRDFNGLDGIARTSAQEFMGYKGIGEGKATNLVATFELGRRRQAKANGDHGQDMSQPAAIHDLMYAELSDADQEELWVILLTKRRKFDGKQQIYKGNLDQIGIQPKVILKHVVKRNALSFAIVHNHPSGDPQPSSADLLATKKIVKAAKDFDVEFVDHVVVAKRGFTSMRHSRLVDFS